MNAQTCEDLREFHRFVGDKVTCGEAALSPEEVLDEWRTLHPTPDAVEEDMAAIQEAIDEMQNGDTGVPFADFDREFRNRRHIPPAS